jgi:trehalose/maltose hydrolase-like predicted phosphorylase
VRNENVARYQDARKSAPRGRRDGPRREDTVYPDGAHQPVAIRMTQAARTRVFAGGNRRAAVAALEEEDGRVGQRLFVSVQQQKELRVEKVVAIHTSRDFAISEP